MLLWFFYWLRSESLIIYLDEKPHKAFVVLRWFVMFRARMTWLKVKFEGAGLEVSCDDGGDFCI